MNNKKYKMKTKTPIEQSLYSGKILPAVQISDHPNFIGEVSRVIQVSGIDIDEDFRIIKFKGKKLHFKDGVEQCDFKSEIPNWKILGDETTVEFDFSGTTPKPIANELFNAEKEVTQENFPYKRVNAFDYFVGIIADRPLVARKVLEFYIIQNDEKFNMYD